MQPDFPKINDICVRIIKRIGDEEVIKVCLEKEQTFEIHKNICPFIIPYAY